MAKITNLEIVQEINYLYSRIQSSRSPLALYMDGDQIRSQNIHGHGFKQVQEDYPDAVIGVYTRTIRYDDFVSDMMHFFKEIKWI